MARAEEPIDQDHQSGSIHGALECQRCEHKDEYFIAIENWPNEIECHGCTRKGPFEVANKGEVEFIDVTPTDLDLSPFEQIRYEPPDPEEFDPPDGHHTVGKNEFVCEKGDPSEIPNYADLKSAIDSAALDREVAERGWEQVKELFESKEKGTTTKGYDLAAKLLSENESFVANRETEELYYYEPQKGFYVRKGRSYIEELLIERIPGHINSGRTKNVFEQVRGRNYVDAAEFNPPKGKVCVANGVLDLETRELEPHSPEYYFTAKFDADYDPDASAPNWVQVLQDSTTSKGEMQKIEEFIGYVLEGWHHKREKNLVIVGPPQSGKSTVMDAIENLLGGMPSVAGLDPHQIAENQFDGSALKDALLNARNDIDGRTIEDSGTLKAFMSGQTVKLESKYADAEFAGPNAKHLYTANWLPAVSGQDDSFYRRILIVEFPNQVPDNERDVRLGDKLEREASGILNRALEARERLNDQDHFTNDRGRTETRHLWDSWRDSNKQFLHTQFEITADMDDKVEKKSYMRAYRQFAAQNGYQLKSQRAVTQSFSWVPEIWVMDDYYAGIKALDKDVTETDANQGGQSQYDEIQKIKAVISTHSTNADLADKQEVVEALNDDIGANKVRQRIEKLKDKKAIIEREGGKLELVSG